MKRNKLVAVDFGNWNIDYKVSDLVLHCNIIHVYSSTVF